MNRTLRASDWSVIRVWEHELTRKGQSRTPGFPFSGRRGKLAGMPRSAKPVRKCHACLLNLGDRCWHYASPRDQWRAKRRCPGIDNEELHAQFRLWLKRPQVKTRKELRREAFGGRTRATVYGGRQPKRGDRH